MYFPCYGYGSAGSLQPHIYFMLIHGVLCHVTPIMLLLGEIFLGTVH